ncbi:Cu resistance protein [Rhizobium sp. Root1203]|uniref:copper homeostasis periplasmic binding protein CopC n=1 Tax=Rhizobium sp. Root1203 TaxID=1736427 RepID=UPI00070F6D1D|nr:copper homeostasis periplasmic binding protein CopC [Rhizobium sp. Root1203]KQV16417.1 Cu resistance protein [Rhizobium sp. Root1203]
MHEFTRLSVICAAISLGLCGQALAHAHLTASVPADKATVAIAPTEIDLRFSEELELKFSGISIVGPGKAAVKVGDARLLDEGKTLTLPVTEKLDAGRYTVEWHVLSTDGHKTKGALDFVVKP